MDTSVATTLPDISARPLQLTCERTVALPPETVYAAWTTDRMGLWFAAPGTVLMQPEVDRPYFFEARFSGERHPHYGRFLRLEPHRLVEMTWLTEAGTRGAETVLTIELTPRGGKTHVRLRHAGFPDEESRAGHAEAWPQALELLDTRLAP